MYHTVYLLIKATVQTAHKTPQEASNEIREKATCTVTDTKKVKIKDVQIMDYKLKS